MRAPDDRHMRTAVTAVAILAASLCGSAGAGTATIDYAALEQLFGEPVTTSATGSPQRESEVAATMTIITAEDIRRSGARDIPGVLRHVGGMDVLHTSNDHSDISVRGYNQAFSPRLLVLVDGRQVYADYYGFTPWSTVPVELAAIRQIEVVKGPNSALFGFNAVGGVINIVTYDPIRDDVDSIAVAGGTQSLKQGSLVSTWGIGDSAGIRLSAGYRDNDDFSSPLPPSAAGVRRGNERGAVNLNAGVNVSDSVRLGLDASYSDSRQAEFSPVYTMSHGEYVTNSIRGHVSADTGVGLLQASVYSNEIETDVFLGGSDDIFLSFDNRVTIAQLQSISRVASGHTVRLTAEYRDNSMATTPAGGAEVAYDVAAVGGMWEWQIAPEVTMTSAVRLDHWSLGRSGTIPPGYGLTNRDWDRSETETSLNAALVWQATDSDTWRFLIGRGIQLPNLLNLGGLVLPIGFGYASGVPDLEPIVVDNYEVSWEHNLSRIPAQLRISAFYGQSRDIVTVSGGARPADGLFGTPVNVGDSDTVGVEASIDGALHDAWRWGFSYKYQNVDDRFDPLYPLQLTFTDFEHTSPHHTARANLGWQSSVWAVDLYARYQDRTQGILSNAGFLASLAPVPSYLSVDARVGYSVDERLTLALSGLNLTRSEQRQTSAPAVERAVFATLAFDFGSGE